MRLSRDRIVEAALRLVEREGWDALSMRRLAQELDVWPMAVYRYFQDKDALVEGLVDAAAESVELPGERGPWRRRMKELLHSAREALRLPSGELALAAGRSDERLAAAGRALLEEAGLGRAEATSAWRALFGYAVGFPALEGDELRDFDYGLERLFDGIESRT